MAKTTDYETRVMIGRNLARARVLSNFSQAKVMQAIFGTKNPKQKNRISEIEHGRILPDAELLHQLCKLYGVSSDYILGFSCETALDPTVGRASMLYNSLSETLGDMLQSITSQLCLVGVRHINTLPACSVLALLDTVKQYLKTQRIDIDSPDYEQLIAMVKLVRQCETQLAIQERDMEIALDDIANRDEEEKRQIILSDLVKSQTSRYRSYSLKNNVDDKDQLSFFE